MKDWIKLFCDSLSNTLWFGIGIIATAITLGAIWQILCNSLAKYLRIF
jgi:hypothetical protein